jgi:hypothetical protein
MQPALFRLGAIVASSEFLTAVPRAAMVQAIKRHATKARSVRHGQPILGAYRREDTGFSLLTAADRSWTAVRLPEEA